MSVITQPLRDEHRELLPEVEVLREAADSVGPGLGADVLAGPLTFLQSHLLPHARAEEAALYPAVAKLMGAPAATATMSRDHVEVGQLTGELAALRDHWKGTAADQLDARRLLYGLYALVHVHFAKEEEVYLPLLDERMPAAEARAMFEAMEAAAAAAKKG